MLKYHVKWMRLMLERCRQIQLSLNIKKCIFSTPICILLGHVICKEGIRVDLAKIKVILDLKPPVNPKQVRIFLGHKGYYIKFIRNYPNITYHMEDLLMEDVPFHWTKEFQQSLEILRIKLVEDPILKFPNWCKKFHLHIDSSTLAIDTILTQPAKYGIDHPNTYASKKLNKVERNYSTTGHEGLGMAFSLQKYRHYLLDNPFIFYTDHQALNYLVNKPLHHG